MHLYLLNLSSYIIFHKSHFKADIQVTLYIFIQMHYNTQASNVNGGEPNRDIKLFASRVNLKPGNIFRINILQIIKEAFYDMNKTL